MNQITLTEKGKDIMTAVNTGGDVQYWVGYFGLAYVPVQNTADPEKQPTDDDYDLGLRGLSTLVGPNEKGDYIYNIWQGDLTGGGYKGASSDFTRLTQYDANLSTNFRYAYDEAAGRNRLIAWYTEGDPSAQSQGLTLESYARMGYKVYNGVGVDDSGNVGDTNDVQYTDSDIPVPAPLLYLGDGLNYGTTDGLATMGSSLGADWPLTGDGTVSYPKVTPDMRCYGGTSAEDAQDDDVITSSVAMETGVTDGLMGDYRCFVSLSNFNKGHSQVSSEGYETDYQESCHNMSRVTKLFPIAKYEITDADPETKGSRTGNANSIKYRLSLDFNGDNRTYRDVLTFEDNDNTTTSVFEENPNNSFKFNRVGIYAVPVSVRKFRKEGSSGCNYCQMEVDPDENPVLVAIISLDEVLLSEDGSIGFTRWAQDFILNLEHVDPETTTKCVRDVEVYYNMAENEAITWYQNQLLASAGLSEAVTTLGVDVAFLKSRMSTPCSDCYTSQASADEDKYASKFHTHDYLKNLVDAEGGYSVRGVNSGENTGNYSLTMGQGVTNSGNGSLVIGQNSSETEANSSIHLSPNGKLLGSGSSGVLMISNGSPRVSDTTNSAILINSGYIDAGSNSIIAGQAFNNFINEYGITTVTLDEFNAAVDAATGTSSLSHGKYYCITADSGEIKAWDSDSGTIVMKALVAGPTAGKFYGASVDNSGRPLYEPTIADGISAEYMFMVPSNTENIISIGEPNGIASNSRNTFLLGGANYSRYTRLENTFILADCAIQLDTSNDRFDGVDAGGNPVQLDISNVTVMGSLASTVLGSVTSSKDLATKGYRDAHIFLSRAYSNPEMYGIFPDPVNPSAGFNGDAYFPLDVSNFDPVTGIYYNGETVGHPLPDHWANGMTEPAIRGMINSATAIALIDGEYAPITTPMIYTGGICLAGQPNLVNALPSAMGEINAGRIKLGSGVLPSAYITTHDVSGWFGNNNFIIPTTISGIDKCPYGGMLLGITGQQEVDGTMHIGLFKYPEVVPPTPVDGDEGKVLTVDADKSVKWAAPAAPHGLNTAFINETVTKGESDAGQASILYVRQGKRYLVTGSSYVTLAVDNNVSDGDEFILAIQSTTGGATVNYIALDAADSMENPRKLNRGSWLCRVASYISDDANLTTTRGLIVAPIGTWQLPEYSKYDDVSHTGTPDGSSLMVNNGNLEWHEP